ncbi:hypothetical protein H6G36_06385 [Anabaena minutissima FACHB-250]|nr:hypothetical protein [Anabaena minutissima FACHB-250]
MEFVLVVARSEKAKLVLGLRIYRPSVSDRKLIRSLIYRLRMNILWNVTPKNPKVGDGVNLTILRVLSS